MIEKTQLDRNRVLNNWERGETCRVPTSWGKQVTVYVVKVESVFKGTPKPDLSEISLEDKEKNE